METDEHKVREGFPGQRSVVLPRPVVASWLDSGSLFDLIPSDVGYYPRAQWHFVERAEGISQAVLIYCRDGAGWARVADATLRVRAGQALMLPPDIPHAYGADAEAPWTIYWIHLAGPKATSLARLLELEGVAPILSPGCDPTLPSLFEDILAILHHGYTPDNLLTAAMTLGQLVTHLVVNRHRQSGRHDRLDDRIKQVIAVMSQHLEKSFRVEDLAQSVNLSPSHFAAIFKHRTGFSVLDFFIRLKMQRACFLLDTTSMPVKTISADLGFDDPLYFSRCFRRVHECSPLQYRAIRKG
ncbi:MAG: helix-turn-helix domain-containing protein [Azospirillaceae bacterium]|nr:helix-turn-helix domain-containing protein [Azospirillaceae bacterium]